MTVPRLLLFLPREGESASEITGEQLRILGIVERTASALSALGVLSIIAAFCLSRHFRNPMHRLIFINAFYNALDVTCTMISVSGPAAGDSSSLCQFQGFLNQMFPISDVLWTLAMAVNVSLIVFRRYDTESLRKLEWKYMTAITIVTFIPAFVFLFIKTDDKGPMYGSVTLWCAIAPKWVLFRIVCYYVPIWTSILITMILYCLVGVEIIRRRRALQAVNSDTIELDDAVMPAAPDSPPRRRHRHRDHEEEEGFARQHQEQAGDAGSATPSTTDESLLATSKKRFDFPTTASDIRISDIRASNFRVSDVPSAISTSALAPASSADPLHTHGVPRRSSLSFRQYVLMPLFFFLALLSVWVAPTTNRVASFADPSTASPFSLLLAVGATGSLRGFWNGVVFLTIGMKSWSKRKKSRDTEAIDLPRCL